MVDYSLSAKILELQDSLMNVDPAIKETYEKMIAEAVSQIHITFDPWMDYEPIFSFLYDISKDRDWCNLSVENGRIVKIQSGYSKSELNGQIYLRDFLIKISPIVCTGAIQLSSMAGLKFHPLARAWIGGVVENGGKT